MSAEQINAASEFFLIAYMIIVTVGAWAFGWISCCRHYRFNTRKRRRTTRVAKVYQTPKTLPSSAMPNVKQATVYTISRRNHGYQAR